jgi:hypothetical protein
MPHDDQEILMARNDFHGSMSSKDRSTLSISVFDLEVVGDRVMVTHKSSGMRSNEIISVVELLSNGRYARGIDFEGYRISIQAKNGHQLAVMVQK